MGKNTIFHKMPCRNAVDVDKKNEKGIGSALVTFDRSYLYPFKVKLHDYNYAKLVISQI